MIYVEIFYQHHLIIISTIAFITELSGSEDEGIDVGQKHSVHTAELKETKIEVEIDKSELKNASSIIKLQHFQLGHTLELSRPLHSLTYFRNGYMHSLISAGTGMVTITLHG